MHGNGLENQSIMLGYYRPITKLNAEIDAGTAREAKNPAVRLGFGVSEGRGFFGPRIGKRKCVSWRFSCVYIHHSLAFQA
jgi:hypothetical protein